MHTHEPHTLGTGQNSALSEGMSVCVPIVPSVCGVECVRHERDIGQSSAHHLCLINH